MWIITTLPQWKRTTLLKGIQIDATQDVQTEDSWSGEIY